MRCKLTHVLVLDRHRVTSKRDHLATLLNMEIIQCSLLQLYDASIMNRLFFEKNALTCGGFNTNLLLTGSSSIKTLRDGSGCNGEKGLWSTMQSSGQHGGRKKKKRGRRKFGKGTRTFLFVCGGLLR